LRNIRFLLQNVRKKHTNIGQMKTPINTKVAIIDFAQAGTAGHVWVPADFAHLGTRDVVDKALQRMVHAGQLRRIDRGLYDRPSFNPLTKKPNAPDYRAVLQAIARRDQLRMLVDPMTAANDLGLTDAVPARVTVYTDARRTNIQLEQLIIEFKRSAPSRLYWADRPAMRVVQALHWLKDTLNVDRERILRQLAQVLSHPEHGKAIHQDLISGLNAMPAWMASLIRELLRHPNFQKSTE
jgi:hypothetical protein